MVSYRRLWLCVVWSVGHVKMVDLNDAQLVKAVAQAEKD